MGSLCSVAVIYVYERPGKLCSILKDSKKYNVVEGNVLRPAQSVKNKKFQTLHTERTTGHHHILLFHFCFIDFAVRNNEVRKWKFFWYDFSQKTEAIPRKS